MLKRLGCRSIGVLFLGLFCAAAYSSAQTFTLLTNFQPEDGIAPIALTQGTDGNFYGTAVSGGIISLQCDGQVGCGTVFKVSAAGNLRTLYEFCSRAACADGSLPYAGLLLATNGNLYGTTSSGALFNDGSMFQVAPNGVLKVLSAFSTQTGYFSDAPLIEAYGRLFGTAEVGGRNQAGTVFQTPFSGEFGAILDFDLKDGAGPRGIIQGADGNLYGVTVDGGVGQKCGDSGYGCGTIFRLTPQGNLKTIYSFCKTDCSDGAGPEQIMQATDGNLYGTTFGGDLSGASGAGVIFRITPNDEFSVLYRFCSQSGCADGISPHSLIQGSDGNLYGVAYQGGINNSACASSGCGTIFKLTPQGTFTTLYSFSPPGAFLPSGLSQGTNGKFYGTALGGVINSYCPFGCGTIFSLDAGLSPFVSLVLPVGRVGQTLGILGQGFSGTTGVMLNGVPASFTVRSDRVIKATVPSGATTGYVTVATPSGTLTSNALFHVIR